MDNEKIKELSNDMQFEANYVSSENDYGDEDEDQFDEAAPQYDEGDLDFASPIEEVEEAETTNPPGLTSQKEEQTLIGH